MARIFDLGFSQIIFNTEDVRSSLKYEIVYQRLDVDLNVNSFMEIPEEFVDNFMLGLTDFSADKGFSILDFQWEFATVGGDFGI